MSPAPESRPGRRIGVLGGAAAFGAAGVAALVIGLTGGDPVATGPDATVDAVTGDVVTVTEIVDSPVSTTEHEACVVVGHRDAARIGEIITVQKSGFPWGDFERGKVEINGVRLKVVPIDERPDPGDVGCGAITMKNGKAKKRKGRCKPHKRPEVDP